jgi:hypothetical protein
MNSKTITISGIEVTFTASAATPRLYRSRFKRDLFQDLQKVADENKSNQGKLPSMEMFEDITFIMAGQLAKPVDEWLAQFELTAIYEALPVIFELWGANTQTISEPRKNEEPLTEI